MERTRKERMRLLILTALAFGCSSASLGGTIAVFSAQPAQAAQSHRVA
ncbi:hypothetical protein [Allosphingosinicella sp.]